MVLSLAGCGGGQDKKSEKKTTKQESKIDPDDPKLNTGIGPIEKIKLDKLDPQMAAEGKEIYEKLCTSCHKLDGTLIGPSPVGILDRRSPEWIMNMILNPEEMVQKDPIAKKLLVEHNLAPMANQNLTEEQARKILEYFRTLKNDDK